MYRCVLVNRWWTVPSLLDKYTKRIPCLDMVWTGSYSEELMEVLQSEQFDLVFATLPQPDEIIDSEIVEGLRKQPALILTSSYPANLYKAYGFNPISFLKEPFPLESLRLALEKFISLEE